MGTKNELKAELKESIRDMIAEVGRHPVSVVHETRITHLLGELSGAVDALEFSEMEPAIENKPQMFRNYLGVRQAIKLLDDGRGDLNLYAITVGEFRDLSDEKPQDEYSVLMAGDDQSVAVKQAEQFCAESLGRPKGLLSILSVGNLTPQQIDDIRERSV